MLRIRSIAVVAGLVPGLALIGATVPAMARHTAAGAVGAPHHAGSSGRVSRSPFRLVVSSHFGEPGNASGYSAIVVSGRRNAWVFGGTNPGGPSTPVAERWNGAVMTRSILPSGLTGFISAASAPSATDIWAASEYGGYLLHWNGSRWHLAKRWTGRLITGVTAISADDVWVFGAVAEGKATGTWHFNGQSWRRVAGGAGSIYRASAISRRNIWAIATGPKGDSVLHYNGRTWRPAGTNGALANVVVSDILATSKRNVWVLGDEVSGGISRLVLAHWDGAGWTRITTGVNALAGRLSAGTHGTVLVTATPPDAAASGLILQANAAGWRRASVIRSGFGSGVSAVAAVRGTRMLLASGGVLTRLGGNAVIWEGRVTPTAQHQDADQV